MRSTFGANFKFSNELFLVKVKHYLELNRKNRVVELVFHLFFIRAYLAYCLRVSISFLNIKERKYTVMAAYAQHSGRDF